MFDNSHNRFYAGLRFVGGIIQITAEASISLLGQVSYTSSSGLPSNTPVPALGALNVTLGLDY